jgi:hypothetical protein
MYLDAVSHLERWANGTDTSDFHALLYTLISKSDPGNRERLRSGFPNEVKAFEDWQAAPNERVFFSSPISGI